MQATSSSNPSTVISSSDSHQAQSSLAESRPRRENRQLPKRFRDMIPQQLPALFPPGIAVPASSSRLTEASSHTQGSTSSDTPSRSLADMGAPVTPRLRRILETGRNAFGLFRRFEGDKAPSHDPEEHVTMTELSNMPTALPDPPTMNSSYYPYPNRSSFKLGEWYWNGGTQKSQASFRELLDIVKDPEFHSEDIENTNWRKVDQDLADGDSDGEEMGLNNGSWKKSNIMISVPFPKKSATPGPKDFVSGDFYHRSIVSIISEKVANHHDCRQFHFEPYGLYWQPRRSGANQDAVRVHGELYTSPAFMDAHNEVQNLRNEPGCDRPKVVVALQFWSDSTHLTSFGNAKLWPLYLWFGNESKYRRCKPSCHLCNHVAYFQPVSLPASAVSQHA